MAHSANVSFFSPSLSAGKVEQENDRLDNVQKYALFDYKKGTTWLAFRDVPTLFKKYVLGRSGIDYGCGAGRSTRYLRAIGLDPVGVDISEKMISEAKTIDARSQQKHTYHLIESGRMPLADQTSDFIFSSFVFLVIPSKDEMRKVLTEMKRVLKDNGAVIIATGSEKMHDPKRDWVSYQTDFPENAVLESGTLAKVRIKEVGAEFFDFNWLDSDYQQVFKESGFALQEKLMPLGSRADDCPWNDELHHSPYYLYVLKKA